MLRQYKLPVSRKLPPHDKKEEVYSNELGKLKSTAPPMDCMNIVSSFVYGIREIESEEPRAEGQVRQVKVRHFREALPSRVKMKNSSRQAAKDNQALDNHKYIYEIHVHLSVVVFLIVASRSTFQDRVGLRIRS